MSDDRHRDTQLSVPRGVKDARGTETAEERGAGKMARRDDREDKGARDRPRTRWSGEDRLFFAGEPEYKPGKGLGAPEPVFAKSTPVHIIDKPLAPGNCDRWDLAMTHAAILGCAGLRVWTDWHPG